MKIYTTILSAIIFLMPLIATGQMRNVGKEGKVSFVTKKNVYVRFENTNDISTGDTLYLSENGLYVPLLVVSQKSSSSCVCQPISDRILATGQILSAFKKEEKRPVITDDKKPVLPVPQVVIPSVESDTSSQTLEKKEQIPALRKQKINGRFSFSTNGSINPGDDNNFQRIRTVLSMNVRNIASTAFSAETYVTYRHRYGIDQVSTGFYDDFKIFGLALSYDNGGRWYGSLGRKMNPFIANMGAIDGLQAVVRMGRYQLGGFAGTRPDFNDFSFNAKLPQFGAFVVRTDTLGGQAAQTSLAVAEQMNDFRTDRRFVYLQHNNSLFKNINLFLSTEVDLFKKVDSVSSTKPALTSLYLSLRYRILKNLTLSGSYDNRRNVIYYESYQTYIDQLLAQETRQGFRLQATYNPVKFVSVNASAFLRYQGSNPQPTRNYVTAVNMTNLAGKGSYLSLSLNLLESYYFKGTITGFRLSESLFKGKLNAEVNYRHVNYSFFANESSLVQDIAGLNVSVNLLRMTSLTASYEGTFQQSGDWHRYFVTIIQRFKN